MNDLVARDARVCWHPYTRHGQEADPLPVVGAHGAWLELADGRRILDGISSWWATLHGHGHPRLVRAIAEQAARLDHVLFAGATHEPAVQLAEELLALAPPGLARVFYSDDGSTAVEVALKLVLQSWVQRGEPQRTVFVALEGAYHGDTFGAMSAGDPEPFFRPFAPLFFRVSRIPPRAEELERALRELGPRAAGLIVEPLVQGAAGMRMYPAEFLRAARELCTHSGVPLVADEVMTGFGRTGALFACGLAGIAPDLLCLGKGLTGGTLPLAATLATEALFECFRSTERARFFAHGHTFTANPIACAAGLASLGLLRDARTPERLAAIGTALASQVADLRADPGVRELRQLGGIVALELEPDVSSDVGYHSTLGAHLRSVALEHGVLLRPLGNVLYALPPACLEPGEVRLLAEALRACVRSRR
ncbi:MAG: adenosylmethionine--8-amino-7-oxononanoate transaminase [Planctomycetota bacterium]